jgi:hypothetical protein
MCPTSTAGTDRYSFHVYFVRGSAHSPEIHHRPRAPALLRIKELYAANSTAVAREVDYARLAAGWDSIGNPEFVVFSAYEVDDDSLELNGSTLDAKLKSPKTLAAVHEDSVVIVSAIYLQLAEPLPSTVIARYLGNVRTAAAEEIHIRPRSPILLRIPKIDAANPAAVTRKVNLTRSPACGNPAQNLKLMILAVLEVDNHPLKLNRPASDLKHKGPETRAIVHKNSIVIIPSINVNSPERFPSTLVDSTPLRVGGDGQT